MPKKQTGAADSDKNPAAAKAKKAGAAAPSKASTPKGTGSKTSAGKSPPSKGKAQPAKSVKASAGKAAPAQDVTATAGRHVTPRVKTSSAAAPPAPFRDEDGESMMIDGGKSFAFPVVGVCASAGGLEAFQAFLKALPEEPGAAFVLVQHMDPHHRSTLPEILEKNSVMPLHEVEDGLKLEPNHVYIGVANAIIDFEDGCFKLSEPSNAQHRYRALDLFLNSLARAAGSRAIGVVLSGTGSDGTQGLQAIKEHSGITFGQDPDTARYGAMPLNAYRAGNVDFQARPEGIANEILRIARNPLVSPPVVHETPVDDEAVVGQIFGLLRNVTRVDFSGYKSNTVRRRITRRMVLRNSGTLAEYLKYLRANSDEVAALYNDLLIKVTEFFRDSDAFLALRKTLKQSLKARPDNKPIRVWVPGCASGEEAYSLAMMLLEIREELGKAFAIQVFGTDLSEEAVARAREGRYDGSISATVDPTRLERFFTKADGSYRVNKPVRELCIFSVHNVVQDPPFSRIDLITCRNLLIYLRTPSQERVLAAFHYGLVEDGHLMLGNSETLGGLSEFFSTVDPRQRIFRRKPGSRPVHFTLPHGRMAAEMGEGIDFGRPTSIPEPSLRLEADRYVLRRHGPPGVVINENLDILQIRGDTSRFIMPAQGDASLNLLRMARSGLEVELRAAFHRAKRDDGAVKQQNVRFLADDEWRSLDLEIVPLSKEGSSPQRYLVLFVERALPPPPVIQNDGDQEFVPKDVSDQEITRLREELRDTREHLQAALEETETANEELRTANEEALSSNEELQSTNEELQTAMEELQSTNEELTTVNEEMQNRNRELDTLNSDLENLLQSASLPIIFVGQDLRIRRFTPQAEKLLHLINTDVGRPVGDMQPRIRVEDLTGRIASVVENVEPYSAEVLADDDKWYELRITPYRTSDHRIDGAVVMMVDIDQLHRRLEETKILIASSHRIADAKHPEDAMPGLLETIGEGMGWKAGEVWVKGPGDNLVPESSWSADEQAARPLLDAGRNLQFKIGSGLPGEAWASQAPVVWENLQAAVGLGFLRATEAKLAGVGAGVALPISSGGKTVRVLVGFTDQVMKPREHATLDALAAQLSLAFSRRSAEAEVAEKAKELAALNTELKMFTRIVAHDLGSPLRSSRLCLDFIDQTKMPAEQAKQLDRAGATLGMVQQLLDGLLQFSRVEAGNAKAEEISLARLAEDLQTGLAAHMKATGGRIDVRGDLRFEGNRVIMYHVISNLVSNGLLHGPEGGVPVVTVSAAKGPEGVRITVQDNGPGISEDKMERLFTRRADGTLDQARLGLALSKHLLRRIGGRLHVSSQQGSGTIVDVTLPNDRS